MSTPAMIGDVSATRTAVQPAGALPNDPRLVAQLQVLARWSTEAVIAIGLVVLAGWVLDLAPLKSILPGYVAMKPNTALGFTLAGLSLRLKQLRAGSVGARNVSLACALGVASIGLATLWEFGSGQDLGIDQLLFEDRTTVLGSAPLGRMAAVTALAFLLSGLAALFLDVQVRPGVWPAQFLALTTGLLGLLGLVGYTYGVSSYYTLARFTQMAIHTVAAFLLYSVGVLCSHPERGLMALVTVQSVGGLAARRLLPAAILIPLVVGWLRSKGQDLDLFDRDLGVALVVVVCMVFYTVLIWITAGLLHRTDLDRRNAEEESRQLNNRLRQEAVERAAQLEASGKTIREAAGQLASAGTQLLAGTRQQAGGAQQQAAAVTQTMTAVAEVARTAERATQQAKGVGDSVQHTIEIGQAGQKDVEDSITSIRAVRDQVESTAENILLLAERAQAIGAIIATVNDIAEQTNILALNAAIEASRAGEHGRSFTVVASEVKALADQSKKSTAQVRQILGEIQNATNTAVLSTEQGTKAATEATRVVARAGETIRTLAETLTQTGAAASEIVASAQQQAVGMAQIDQAMQDIEQITTRNLEAIRQVEQAAQELNALSTRLAALAAT